MCAPRTPTDEEKDLVRQGERTIDNLKRLFAVVFAISFAVVGTGVIDKLRPILANLQRAPHGLWLLILNIEMIAVFVITAGVFYHQSVKFLDIRYAKHPLSQVHPLGFAWDYFTLVLTAAPFFFMAHSLHPTITHEVGYIWFFVSYVLLLSLGLALLLFGHLRHSKTIRGFLNESIDPGEIVREGTLRTYWLIMNGMILLLLLVAFRLFAIVSPCPASSPTGSVPIFLYFFGIFALLRDYLDYRYAWRFLYPTSESSAPALDRWPITKIVGSKNLTRWIVLGSLFVAICAALLFNLEFWNLSYWAPTCKLQ
jgi:protein-S-isoprenylcysteine O-methyltransferase Ste14